MLENLDFTLRYPCLSQCFYTEEQLTYYFVLLYCFKKFFVSFFFCFYFSNLCF